MMGIVHVMIGTAGHSLNDQEKYLNESFIEYSIVKHYGYGRFAVSRNMLDFEFKERINGDVIDSFTLYKSMISSTEIPTSTTKESDNKSNENDIFASKGFIIGVSVGGFVVIVFSLF